MGQNENNGVNITINTHEAADRPGTVDSCKNIAGC